MLFLISIHTYGFPVFRSVPDCLVLLSSLAVYLLQVNNLMLASCIDNLCLQLSLCHSSGGDIGKGMVGEVKSPCVKQSKY